jgi:hypothetical protein
MYALSEVQVSSKQLLSSLGFEERVSKTQKTTLDKKTRVSTRKGITSKSTTKSTSKVQEKSPPVARETRSSKRKFILHHEEEIKKESKFPVSKQECMSYDKVYTRRMTRQMAQELQKVKIEPEIEIHDIPIEKPPMIRQSKRNKGKQPANCPSRPKTWPTNKLRLNSKALSKPSMKEEKLIIIDDDDILENILEITKKERMTIKTLREMPIRKTRKGKQQ